LQQVAERNGGVFPSTFEVNRTRYQQLYDEMNAYLHDDPFGRGNIADETGLDSPLMAPIGRSNILVIGVPVITR
jgi:hypothetical protein